MRKGKGGRSTREEREILVKKRMGRGHTCLRDTRTVRFLARARRSLALCCVARAVLRFLAWHAGVSACYFALCVLCKDVERGRYVLSCTFLLLFPHTISLFPFPLSSLYLFMFSFPPLSSFPFPPHFLSRGTQCLMLCAEENIMVGTQEEKLPDIVKDNEEYVSEAHITFLPSSFFLFLFLFLFFSFLFSFPLSLFSLCFPLFLVFPSFPLVLASPSSCSFLFIIIFLFLLFFIIFIYLLLQLSARPQDVQRAQGATIEGEK
jgi:hypothetical protein